MSDNVEPVRIRILDQEYTVACPPGEKDGLLGSAQLLDQRMRELRDGNRSTALDRLAVIAALNLTHELLQSQESARETERVVEDRVRMMEERIARSLPESGSGHG